MDKAKKKELTEQYKETLLPMGVYQVRCLAEPAVYLAIAKNLKGKMNGDIFKLNSGNHTNRQLQQAWKKYGKDQFVIETLEELDYNEKEPKADYTEDLMLLLEYWTARLTEEKLRLY